MFVGCDADIAVFGGAAGGGKSYGLELCPLQFVDRKGFGGVIFRRTYPEITNEGGPWDTSEKIYPYLGAVPIKSATEWRFPSGVAISFAHMQHEKDKHAWQGSAIPFLGFDELTHFSRGQFFYMVSRNRLTHDCGVRPFIRATCNPDPDSWVADFLSWWIDPETGFPIPERAGVKRWFIRDGDTLTWADTMEELLPQCKPGQIPKSVTFIPSKLTDNPALIKQDPSYMSNLHSLPLIDRMRLLEGNWKVRAVAGMFFQRAWYGKPIPLEQVPAKGKTVRYWDRASTEPSTQNPDPDWTVGVKMRKVGDLYYVINVVRLRGRPEAVLRIIKSTAINDGLEVTQIFEEDPGSAGKAETAMYYRELAGLHVTAVPARKSKAIRARPFSSASEGENVKIVQAQWNEKFFDELESFADWDEVEEPPKPLPHDDQVDAASGAYNYLSNAPVAGRGNF
jgi:predicted phage terminase large subunit-like protein